MLGQKVKTLVHLNGLRCKWHQVSHETRSKINNVDVVLVTCVFFLKTAQQVHCSIVESRLHDCMGPADKQREGPKRHDYDES